MSQNSPWTHNLTFLTSSKCLSVVTQASQRYVHVVKRFLRPFAIVLPEMEWNREKKNSNQYSLQFQTVCHLLSGRIPSNAIAQPNFLLEKLRLTLWTTSKRQGNGSFSQQSWKKIWHSAQSRRPSSPSNLTSLIDTHLKPQLRPNV